LKQVTVDEVYSRCRGIALPVPSSPPYRRSTSKRKFAKASDRIELAQGAQRSGALSSEGETTKTTGDRLRAKPSMKEKGSFDRRGHSPKP
jgi:hypothetical protein